MDLKLEQLETLCSELETSNASALDEKSSFIENKLEHQRTQLLSVEQDLEVSKVAMENQEDTIRKLEAAVQQIPSTSTGGRLLPQIQI